MSWSDHFILAGISLFFLFGAFITGLFHSSLLQIGKYKANQFVWSSFDRSFFFKKILQRSFSKRRWENLILSSTFTIRFSLLFYVAIGSILYFRDYQDLPLWKYFLGVLFLPFLLDFLAKVFSSSSPKNSLKVSALFTSIYLTLFFPLTIVLLQVSHFFWKKRHHEKKLPSITFIREQIKEICSSELNLHLSSNDLYLITAFLNFRDRIAKEIMIPRVDIVGLEKSATIKEAMDIFREEGYSRVPVYEESMDQTIGILHYKEILKYFAKSEETKDPAILEKPVKDLMSPVFYIPESKKISLLLQEFRSKQLHIAIVVDEYGGTEGIVTIEDILEEIVGEIEDEYDFDEDQLFWKLPSGGWIVDAKMSIIDIESKLHIKIPHHPDYETIGGYIFYRSGTIPAKGWTIHHDEFTLEVLNTSDRSIEKIRIVPRNLQKKSSKKAQK